MILINLLPYREAAREAKQKQFVRTIVLCAILGLVISGVTYFLLDQAITEQNIRNEAVQAAINAAKEDEKKVEALKAEREQLLAKKKKVEELQQERGRAAKMVDEITAALPPGTALSSIASSGSGSYALVGKSTSDNRIASFMSNLPRTGMFHIPTLTAIKKGTNAQDFTLVVKVAPYGTPPPLFTEDDAIRAIGTVPETPSATASAEEVTTTAPANETIPEAPATPVAETEKVGE